MCISFQASIIAGVIGESCAIMLVHKGQFANAALIAAYSLIQFYEAYAYFSVATPPVPIQILLALQGVAYFGVSYYNERDVSTLCVLFVSILIFAACLLLNEPYGTNCSKGCEWGISYKTGRLLSMMYVCMVMYGLSRPHLRTLMLLLLCTLLVSRLMPNMEMSWWCYTSAISVPLYLILLFLQERAVTRSGVS